MVGDQFFYSYDLNPLTPSYYQPYTFYNVSSENLVLDQLIFPKLIFFLILITYLVDIVLTLYLEKFCLSHSYAWELTLSFPRSN